MKTPDAFTLGKYLGFLTSMLLFTTILYFVTKKIGWHSYEYLTFVAGFAILYFGVKTIKAAVINVH